MLSHIKHGCDQIINCSSFLAKADESLEMGNIAIDTLKVRHLFNRNALQLTKVDFIFAELAKLVISRLDYIKLQPLRVLDCGSGLGLDRALLAKRFPQSQIIELDIAFEVLRLHRPNTKFFSRWVPKSRLRQLLCADAAAMPLASQSIDLFYTTLLLPYVHNLAKFFQEVKRVMASDAAFCIAGLGCDSLKELRALGFNTFQFPDMHDVGDMLLAAGFSNPVVDSEYLTIDYDQLATLIDDVKLIGCGNAGSGFSNVGKQELKELKTKFNLPAKLTLEIFVAHGWQQAKREEQNNLKNVIQFYPNTAIQQSNNILLK